MRFERRGYRGFRSMDIPKPVKAGEEYDVEISEVGSKGDGIARVKNFVVFVADAKKDEKVKIRIKEVMNRFAIGEKVGEAGSKPAETTEAVEEVEEPEEEVEEEEVSEEE
jgi:predicted RNA-binding protein with TRAM domain